MHSRDTDCLIMAAQQHAQQPAQRRWRDLHAAVSALAEEAQARFDRGEYLAFLQGLSALKGPIDKFFDDVMVMVEDEALRRNRLALLNEISALFGRLAQFTVLQLA